jgi:hypothetical protein
MLMMNWCKRRATRISISSQFIITLGIVSVAFGCRSVWYAGLIAHIS